MSVRVRRLVDASTQTEEPARVAFSVALLVVGGAGDGPPLRIETLVTPDATVADVANRAAVASGAVGEPHCVARPGGGTGGRVLLPEARLDALGIGEGDELVVTRVAA